VIIKSVEEVKNMDALEIKAIVDAALAEQAAAVKATADKAAELKAAQDAGYKMAVEELKGKIKSTNYVKSEIGDDNDGEQAFKAWMQTGQENEGLIRPNTSLNSIKAAFNVTTGASGGYMVPDPTYNRIIAKRGLRSWVRQAPTQKFTTVSDHLLIPTEDTSHTAFVVTNESAAYNENEGTVAQVDLALLKYTKLVKVTEEFLAGENSGFDSWLVDALARAEAVTENTVATTAILASATAATAAAAATALTIPEIYRLIGSLGEGYNVNGETGFLMKNSTKWYLKGVEAVNYQMADINVGYPAYVSDDMPAMTAGLRSTLYGNFNYFAVLERPGMLVQRNPYLYMANGQVGIFANIYRGFAVLQAEAFYTMAQG
jgi:HK97 family phage major capsid protein